MKSLRKTGAWTCALLAWPATLLLAGQAPQQSSPRPTEQRGSPPRDATQQPSAPPLSDAQAKITVNSNLVILPVTVKNGDGELVSDLRKDDFRVFEDKVEQKIDVFTSEAFPLS